LYHKLFHRMMVAAVRVPLWIEVLFVWLITVLGIGAYWAFDDLLHLQARESAQRRMQLAQAAEQEQLLETQHRLQQQLDEQRVQVTYIQTIFSTRSSARQALQAIENRLLPGVDVSQLEMQLGEQLTLDASVHPGLTNVADWLDALRSLPPFIGLPHWTPLDLQLPDSATLDVNNSHMLEKFYHLKITFQKTAEGKTAIKDDGGIGTPLEKGGEDVGIQR